MLYEICYIIIERRKKYVMKPDKQAMLHLRRMQGVIVGRLLLLIFEMFIDDDVSFYFNNK